MNQDADKSLDHLRDMYATHTLFRREFGLAPGLVRDVAEDDARRVRLVCEHLDLIMTLLDLYRHSQDACGPPGPGIRFGEGDRARLHQAIGHVTALIGTWGTSASSLHAKQLAGALEQLNLLLNEHMARQEEVILWPQTASIAS